MGCTKNFILMVQKHPILYDQAHPEYKNSKVKDKVWMEIGEKLEENGEELKKKWKNLRDTYAKYIRKTKTKTTQAANTKKKKWIWANQMEIFKPYLMFDKTVSNADQINSDSVTVNSDEDLKLENNPVELLLESESPNANIYQSPNSQPKKEKQTRKVNDKFSFSTADFMKCFHNKSKKKRKNDAIDSLMLAHAKTIKTFSRRRQIFTKMKIAKVIMEEELLNSEEFSSKSERHSTSTSSPCSSTGYDEPADVKSVF